MLIVSCCEDWCPCGNRLGDRLIRALLRAAKNNGLVSVALALGDLAVVPGSFFGLAFCLPIDSLCLSSRLLWLLWQDSRVMYPLFADCTKKGSPWQRLREMHAFCAEAGRIFIPCIRFGVQSGDFGYIARESCQGGPFFASRSLESCMGRRSCRRSTLCGPLRSGGQPIAEDSRHGRGRLLV